MKSLLYVFVTVAGVLTSIETGMNAQLTKTLGNQPWWPALFFTAVSAVCLLLAAVVTAAPFPAAELRAVPWWGWLGGVISALYVVSMLVAPGVLGAGLFTGLTVSAAVIASIALDHFGWIGFPVHVAGLGRLVGAALMVAGITLIALF